MELKIVEFFRSGFINFFVMNMTILRRMMKMPKSKGIKLNEGDVIQVLNYTGIGRLNVEIRYVDNITVKVTIEGWYDALSEVSIERLKEIVSQFVKERVKLIPEARFEDALSEVSIERLKKVVSQVVEERVKLIAEAKFEEASIIFK
jgi:hypothetical protein